MSAVAWAVIGTALISLSVGFVLGVWFVLSDPWRGER